MRRFIAPLVTTLSLAVLPVPAVADAPASGPHDCAKRCACASSAKGTGAAKPENKAKPTGPWSREPSELLKSIWTSP